MTITADQTLGNKMGHLSHLAVLRVISQIGTGDSIRSQRCDLFRMRGWHLSKGIVANEAWPATPHKAGGQQHL